MSMVMVLSLAVPTFAAATSNSKEDENNPEINIRYEKASSGYTMSFTTEEQGLIFIDNVPYKTKDTYNVQTLKTAFSKSDTSCRLVSNDKVYYLKTFRETSPSPATNPDGTTEYIGSWSATCELFYAKAPEIEDVGSNYSTSTTTVKNVEYETTQKYVDKYFIDSKQVTEAEYNNHRSTHSCKESYEMKLTDTSEPVLSKTETSAPVITSCKVTATGQGYVYRQITVTEWYDVTQTYTRTHSLETLTDGTTEGDYSGTLKIDAMNNLGSAKEVTGNIELSDNTINFSSERFNITNGKGTFKTNSQSAITLKSLLVGQTYKISNVKVDGAEVVLVSPATGKIASGTVVKVTLKNPATNTTNYTITWKNWDGSVLKTQVVSAGSVPSYSGTPTRPADSNYTYTFKGWSPSVTAATSNVAYTACFTAVPKQSSQTYTITWKNWNGSVLKTQVVSAGSVPSYGGTPTRPADSNYTYTFKGWSPSVTAATSNVTYTAQFTAVSKPQTYTITWKNWNGQILSTSTVKPNSYPVYNGKTPTRASDSKYTYTFSGWTPAPKSATQNTVYTAKYTAKAKPAPLNIKVKISTPKASKAAVTVKWKKLSKKQQKQISSYQIQYSTSNSFKSAKIVKAGKSTASKKISKLKRRTIYYVRVRAVKGAQYGPWSTAKVVKTK